MENPMKIHDLGVSLFLETPMFFDLAEKVARETNPQRDPGPLYA